MADETDVKIPPWILATVDAALWLAFSCFGVVRIAGLGLLAWACARVNFGEGATCGEGVPF